MKATINMINVEDGDAIFIGLEKDGEKALVAIDGGFAEHYDGRVRKRLDELLEEYDNKIRLLVCTHYDNDHLAGAEKILDNYHSIIEEIWIHRIEDSLGSEIRLLESLSQALTESLKENSGKNLETFDTRGYGFVLESIGKLRNVLGKIEDYDLEGKCRQVTRGDSLRGFEEFEVISPTSDYYNELLNRLKGDKLIEDIKRDLTEREHINVFSSFTNESEMRVRIDQVQACDKLEESSVAKGVSATNLCSIVCLLTIDEKKFLFTGDAGIESFESEGLLDEKVQGLFWLQLPHHGSKNNTSKKMLDHFNPIHVFVSSDGGPNRPHKNLRDCLNQKRAAGNILVTNDPETTWYLSIDENGNVRMEH